MRPLLKRVREMTTRDQAQPFDPVEFKQKARKEWNDAAAGWRRWHHGVEGEAGVTRADRRPHDPDLGRHDCVMRLRIAEAASVRYGWPLHVIEVAGHNCSADQPEAVLRALRCHRFFYLSRPWRPNIEKNGGMNIFGKGVGT